MAQTPKELVVTLKLDVDLALDRFIDAVRASNNAATRLTLEHILQELRDDASKCSNTLYASGIRYSISVLEKHLSEFKESGE